jgi:hypothetical protein
MLVAHDTALACNKLGGDPVIGRFGQSSGAGLDPPAIG